ncbi:MAG: hypothetical protein JW861_00915 [Bacteroidales bacterium]|nr:hypothetical protein [Bacteroidales bacterium]
MKTNVFFTAYFFMMALMISTALGQNGNYSVTIDPYCEGKSIARVTDTINGTQQAFIIKGSPDVSDFILHMDGEYQEPGFQSDVFDMTLWLPEPNGGALPKDVIFVPANNKLYAFGNRRISVIDPFDFAVIDGFTVSDFGQLNQILGTFLYPYERRLAFSSWQGFIYCATDGKELVVINPVNNEMLITHNDNEVFTLMSTSVLYEPVHHNIIWILNYWEGVSKIKVYPSWDGTAAYEESLSGVIYDALLKSDGNVLYVSTSGGFKLINISDLSVLHTEPYVLDKLVSDGNNVYGHSMDHTIVRKFNGQTGNYTGSFELGMLYVADALYNNDGRLYFAGGSWLKEYDVLSGEVYQVLNIEDPRSLHLDQEMNQILCGADNRFVTINNDNTIFCESDLMGCQSTDVSMFTYQGTDFIISSNLAEGTIMTFIRGCILYRVNQTGAGCFAGCHAYDETKNINKAFLMQTRSEYNTGSITVIDGETNDYITHLQVGKNMKSCVFNEAADKVFVACFGDHAIKVIDAETNALTDVIPMGDGPLVLLSWDDYIYCGATQYVFRINAHTYAKTQFPLPYVWEFAKDEINERVYTISGSGGFPELLAIDHITGAFEIPVTMPTIGYTDIVFAEKAQKIYLLNYWSTYPVIHVVDVSNNYQLLDPIFPPGGYRPKFAQYSAYEDKLYIVNNLGQSTNSQVSIVDCKTDQYIIHLQTQRSEVIDHNQVNDKVYYYNVYPESGEHNEIYIKTVDGLYDEQADLVPSGNRMNVIPWFYFPSSYKNPRLIFNTHDNKVISGNYSFSNATVVKCFTDKLHIGNGWNWLSFPRLERFGNEAAGSIASVDQRILPWPPDYARMHFLEPPTASYILYDPPNPWIENGLPYLYSTYGYKLEVTWGEPTSPYFMKMQGAQLHPSTVLTLDPGVENWTGYFLEQAQYPQEAFPGGQAWMDEHLKMIKTQYWTMIKEDNPGGEGYIWRTDGRITPFCYGDLVILKTDNEDILTFQWNWGEEAGSWDELPQPEYYSYDEYADYIPFYVEFDSVATVQEIALLAGGEVRGAAVRLPGDTVVEVNAYLQGVPPGSAVTFETWNGYKASVILKTGYRVYDPATGRMEQRCIYAGEGRGHYVVSLREEAGDRSAGDAGGLVCYPSPSGGTVTVSFTLSRASEVMLEAFSPDGRRVAVLMEGMIPEGLCRTEWQPEQAGVYTIRLGTGQGTALTAKTVVIK